MASALQRGSYALCGEEADGAISWVCPGLYLRDVALPAMHAGAERAGRPVPPLIAHAPVCVHEHADEVRGAVREQLATYPRLPFYQRMLMAAGFAEVANNTWSDRMIDAVVLWGNEAHVEERLRELLQLRGHGSPGVPVSAGSNRHRVAGPDHAPPGSHGPGCRQGIKPLWVPKTGSGDGPPVAQGQQ